WAGGSTPPGHGPLEARGGQERDEAAICDLRGQAPQTRRPRLGQLGGTGVLVALHVLESPLDQGTGHALCCQRGSHGPSPREPPPQRLLRELLSEALVVEQPDLLQADELLGHHLGAESCPAEPGIYFS